MKFPSDLIKNLRDVFVTVDAWNTITLAEYNISEKRMMIIVICVIKQWRRKACNYNDIFQKRSER